MIGLVRVGTTAGVFVVGLASLVAGPARAQWGYDEGYGGQTIRCESSDMRQRYCSVDTRGGVRLVRQYSNAGCHQGRSWGWDGRGIWVSGGCRAEFQVGRGGGGGWGGGGWGQGNIVRCESQDRRQRHCPADTRGGVRLVRKLSGTECYEGHNWGYDRGGIWVNGGCRGEFEVGRGGGWGGGGGWGQGNIVRCESQDRRQRHCPADTRGGVRLVRKLSGTECYEGHNWGYDRGGIWVNGGCRGEFEVGRGGGWGWR